MWWWILAASAASWATKAGGLSVPTSWMAGERSRRISAFLPVTMLAGLAAASLVDDGGAWHVEPALLVGAAAGVVVVVTERGGVLGAFVVGAVTTALVRVVLG